MIQKINENGEIIETYRTINDAAASINNKMEVWQIALNIAYAIINNTKAYKYNWEQID